MRSSMGDEGKTLADCKARFPMNRVSYGEPRVPHPYMDRFDLVERNTGRYLGALFPIELPDHALTIEWLLVDDPFHTEIRGTHRFLVETRAFENRDDGAIFRCYRGGLRVSKGQFDQLVEAKLAVAHDTDPMREEKYLWHLDRRRKAA